MWNRAGGESCKKPLDRRLNGVKEGVRRKERVANVKIIIEKMKKLNSNIFQENRDRRLSMEALRGVNWKRLLRKILHKFPLNIGGDNNFLGFYRFPLLLWLFASILFSVFLCFISFFNFNKIVFFIFGREKLLLKFILKTRKNTKKSSRKGKEKQQKEKMGQEKCYEKKTF